MVVSQNGYIANDITRTQSWKIPGTDRAIRLRKGSPGALLVHFAAWFDKNVEDIEAGQLDDWGYAERNIRGSETTVSNHASGTAMDLNATRHPLGKRGTFTATQAARIRTKLKEYNGCIRWGGDYVNRADEMHFEIVRDVAACDAAWKKITTKPPAGGTTMADIRDTESYRANVQYGLDFWIAPTGTGKALIDLVKKISLQCDRIEDDTDDGLALKADVAAARDLLNRNMQLLAAQATDAQDDAR